LLADYGADVVKLELPRVGDGARGFPPHKDGKALWWKVTNRGKRFATLDLRKPEGAALLLRMLPALRRAGGELPPRHAGPLGADKAALWTGCSRAW
jgi:hypothetical protein